MIDISRGFGEVGIALGWQPGDQGFESPKLHHIYNTRVEYLVLFLVINQFTCHKDKTLRGEIRC